MTGQLREHPLAELLHEISDAGLSGALRVEHERRKTVVYLLEGAVVYATSNLRQHRLSECLLRWQALSGQELPDLPADASDLDLAAALIEEKMFSRESLETLQARQVTEILLPNLLWTDGTWTFDARVRINSDVRVPLDLRKLLVEGARRLPAEFAASRFSDPSEKVSPEAKASADLALLPMEAFVLSRVDAPLSLSELLAVSSLPETTTKQVVYTLALARLLERERWPRAFSAEMLERARSVKPAAQAGAQPPAKSELKQAVELVPPVVAAAPDNAEVNEEKEVAALFARLALAVTHYQVLGVSSTSSIGDIKSTYHKLAKRFHPDRFYGGADAALHTKIGEAFARIAQAYETLKDRQGRAAYDLKLSHERATAQAGGAMSQQGDRNFVDTQAAEDASGTAAQAKSSQFRQAEESFARGVQALKQGKPLLAIAPLGEATRLAPREARYRAYYGRALSANEGTWRQAEAELKAAITLDSKNASYHVMLAEFYSKIGLPRRAQSELERALALNPQDATTRRLLDNVQATLKGQM